MIPVHDLGALLRSVGVVELREDELQALISEELFDKTFDLPEFLALLVEIGHTLPAPGTEKKQLRAAFKQADSDGDGYLTPAELRQAMDGMAAEPLDDAEFDVMLREPGAVDPAELPFLRARHDRRTPIADLATLAVSGRSQPRAPSAGTPACPAPERWPSTRGVSRPAARPLCTLPAAAPPIDLSPDLSKPLLP